MPRSHLPQRPIGSKCLGPIEVIGPPQHYFHDCTNEAAIYVRVNCHTGYVLNLWKLKTVNAPQPGKGVAQLPWALLWQPLVLEIQKQTHGICKAPAGGPHGDHFTQLEYIYVFTTQDDFQR